MAGILSRDQIHPGQKLYGPVGNVSQVTDRSCYNIKAGLRHIEASKSAKVMVLIQSCCRAHLRLADIGYHSAASKIVNIYMIRLPFYALLTVSVLVLLTACGTPVKRDAGYPPGRQADSWDYDPGQEQFQPGSAGKNLAEIASMAAGMQHYQPELALEILRSLESFPSARLNALIDQQSLDPEFTEWLELALQVRSSAISGKPTSSAAAAWTRYHYGHVVTQGDFSALADSYRALFPVPSQVAVLLPSEGRLSTAAKAIRDGIVSAYLDHPGDAVIRFYASGETVESATAAYRQAGNDGALQIIGPLYIESTRAIAALTEAATPALLLNEKSAANPAPTETAPGIPATAGAVARINSLSLSTSQEATAIANKALAQGQFEAIVITPNSAWGERIESAFVSAFRQGGGRIIASTRYNGAKNDHSAMLTGLLKIDESQQRKSDLQSWLGVPLAFEPIRRHDFDFIFLAATPVEGREIKPLLRFHDAGDVPVYALGRIYGGRLNQDSDQDLNGIVFPATHWQLQALDGDGPTSANRLTSVRSGTFGNLYALGMDAWRVLPWLPLMQKDPDLSFPGEIGLLRLLPDGSLHREPAWAQFSAGRPTVFQWPAVDGKSAPR